MNTITSHRKNNPVIMKHIRAGTVLKYPQSTIQRTSVTPDLPEIESEYMIHTYCRPNGLPVMHQDNKKDYDSKGTLGEDISSAENKGFVGSKVINSTFLHPKFYVRAKELKINLSTSVNSNVTTYSQYKLHVIKKHSVIRQATSASNFYGYTPSVRASLFKISSPNAHLKKPPPAGLKIPPELYNEIYCSKND